jgi:hypothetical protein
VKKLSAILAIIIVFSSGCAAKAAAEATPAPEDRKVITGEVVETIGNMVTLKLMEDVEMPQPSEMTEEERQAFSERMAQRQQITPGAERPARDGEASSVEAGEVPSLEAGEAPSLEAGEVPSLEAGEVPSLEAGEVPSGQTRRGSWSGGDGATTRGSMAEMTEEQRAAFQERMAAVGDGASNFAEMTDEERQAFFQNSGGMMSRGSLRSYTGEQADIIIPVGAPITESSSTTGGQETESEIAIDNIKSGDILKVTYASDGETVAKVVKQPATSTFRGRTGTGEGESGFPGGGFGGEGRVFSGEIPDGGVPFEFAAPAN